jgi:predicted transcriptional regulator
MAGGRRHHGDLESAVLRAVWASSEPVTPAEVRDLLGGGDAYTTVLTVLTRLWEKGLLARERRGKAHVYRAVVDEAELTAGQMEQRLRLANDRAAVLARFVDALDPDEAALLRRLLELPAGGAP